MTTPDLLGLPPDLDDEALRVLLAALKRYGFSIDDVPRPDVRKRLLALDSERLS